jgi:osmotically-inducible protein OsmY
MMNERKRMPILVLAAASFALIGAGCSDPTPTTTSRATPPPTVAQKMESAGDKMATATDKATVNAAATIDDATITTKVKAAVLAEPGLKSLKIDVDTKDAVVTLNGTVESPALKERATQIAQNVGGVRQVVDNLVVKSS